MAHTLLWVVLAMTGVLWFIAVLWLFLKAGTAPRSPLDGYDGRSAWPYDSH